jgi:hypothetical protein
MANSVTESDRAALSKRRGELAAAMPLTPQQRRDYISLQGRAESSERSSGVGSPASDPRNFQAVRSYTETGAERYLGRKWMSQGRKKSR